MVRLSDIASQFLERYEKEYIVPPELIETPALALDPEQYKINIITAPPATGKSAFALQTAALIARQGAHAVYFSFEMSEVVLFMRLLAHLGKTDKQAIERRQIPPEKIKHIICGNASVLERIAVSTAMGEKDIRKDIETIMNDPDITNLKLFIFLDYLQKLNMFQLDDPRLIAEKTMNTIGRIVNDYKACAFVISSANRSAYETGGLDSSRNSGQIEFDADSLTLLQLVVFDQKTAAWKSVDRKDYAAEQTKDRVYVQASLIKNRHGAGMQKVFLFDKPTQTFSLVTAIGEATDAYIQEQENERSNNNEKKGRPRKVTGVLEI